MRQIRYYFRLFLAFVNKFKGIILLGIIIGFVIFIFGRYFLPNILNKSVTKIAITGHYTTDNLPKYITEQISGGLTVVNENGIPEPYMASSWTTPDKGITWIFTLKDNIFWQDKKKVTSADINYKFDDVSIERPDDKTIIFKLKEQFSPFPSIVSKPLFRKGLLGVGKMSVKKIKITGNYIYELTLKDKDKNIIIYKFYPTIERSKLAFKLGEVNKIDELSEIAPFDEWSNVKVIPSINRNHVVTLFINTKDSLLSDKSIRQALAYAINKDLFKYEKAYSPLSTMSWAYNPLVKPYEYDVKRSIALLAEVPKDLLGKSTIRLITTPSLLKIAEVVAELWTKIGINVTVQVSSVKPNDFQVYLAIFEIPSDPDQYSIWHSTQTTTNITKYSNPRIDKLLETGRSEIKSDDRYKTYLDFQRFLVEDLPAIFLYYPEYYSIIRK